MRSSFLSCSPLTSSPFPSFSNQSFYRSHSAPIKTFSFIAASCSSSRSSPHDNLRIGSPQPPWLVLPPVDAPTSSPFADREAPMPPTLFDFQVKGSSVGIPSSLRLVQLMKKKMRWRRARLAQATPTGLDPIGSAVWSLASVVEELQRLALPVEDEGSQTGALKDISESILWLFEKVFCASPNLAVDVLVLVARFLATSTKREIPTMIMKVLESMSENSAPCRPPRCWSDIGVLEESEADQFTRTDSAIPYYRRRRMAYEQLIISGNIDSLILSNYAQLLYEYENDLERANDYFNWAVMTEPVDAEAMNKYGRFLWLGRGELEKAEEMYLEAIQAEPEDSHHQSSYAWFLWRTGGLDTCFPLEACGDDDDAVCEDYM